MATISNVNGKKITKIKYKGEIFDTGGGGASFKRIFNLNNGKYFCAYSNTYVQNIFYYMNYEELSNILSYSDTSNCTNFTYMFGYCQQITNIPLIDTSNATTMDSMFYECVSLISIPQLNTINVTNMNTMFYSCYLLSKIDITHMNITSTSYSNNFAKNCYSLTKLIIRNMTTIPALNSNAFDKCYHFTGTTDATYNPQGLKDGRIYVPDDKVEALKTATNWSVYADIIVPLSTLVE